jgi:hypothetical protein
VDFEHQLRSVLERKDVPSGFAARVISKARGQRKVAGVWANWRRWTAVPVASSLLVLVIGIEQQRERRERRQGEAAKEQLMQALQITSGKLDRIQKKVRGVLK